MSASHTQSLPEEAFFNENIMKKMFYISIGSALGHLCEIESRSVANIDSIFI